MALPLLGPLIGMAVRSTVMDQAKELLTGGKKEEDQQPKEPQSPTTNANF